MQLFSRNKALVALSLGALVALGACGDDVTVPAPVSPAESVSISPSNANMNVGETLNFAVQITGGAASTTLASCTSSSATVATAAVNAGACRVTAVAAGNATITATTSTGKSAAAAVAVAAPAPAITGLTVSPSAAQVAVGQSVTLVPSATRANASVNVAYTYTSSAAAVATVSSTGVVTAVAPGVASITISATGTGTGLASASLSTATAITVSDRTPGLTTLQVSPATASLTIGGTQQITASAQGPRASAATMTYGTSAPAIATVSSTGVITAVAAGTATITVTAQSTQDGAFAASSLTGLITVTVNPAAQVVITSLSQYGYELGGLIDLNNVGGQLTVKMTVQPNGQQVSALQVWVCEQGEAVAACATRSGTPAAEQTFAGSAPAASDISLFFNTAEFAAPNFTTGADAVVNHKNGLKTIVATLRVANGATPVASNTISAVNFNNNDSWTIAWTQPANRANDASGNTWLGGPDTPDALLPGSSSGTSSFVVVPVIYTPNRTINSVTLNVTGLGCGSNIIDRARPFGGRFGDLVRDTTTVSFNCEEQKSLLSGVAPSVVASIDNNSAAGPAVVTSPTAGSSIFAPIGWWGSINTSRYLSSNSYRPTTLFMPFDYEAPDIAAFDVRGGGGSTSPDSGWVNGAYAFNDVVNTTTGATRYSVADSGVGLLSSRNTQFSVCNIPSPWSDTSITECPAASAVRNGGLTATVASMGLGESADLTNAAYFAVVRETDRLGNRTESNPRTVTIPAASSPTGAALTVPVTPALTGNANSMPTTFGVDLTAPALVDIPAPVATGANPLLPSIAGYVQRTGIDSIFGSSATDAVVSASSITASNARFAVRARDSRSGFQNCSALRCYDNPNTGLQVLGTFSIVRRVSPLTPSLTNDALVQTLTNANPLTGSAVGNVMAGTVGADPQWREFQIPVGGVQGREATLGSGAILAPTIGNTTPGYYTFTATVRDRAGNTTVVTPKSVALDLAAPVAGAITLPVALTGGSPFTVGLSGTDDLEIMGADLAVRYTIGADAYRIQFQRVTNFAATVRTGLFHGPFASLADNKLASRIGAGYTYSGNVNFPIPVIQDLQVTSAGNQPQVPGVQVKPNLIGARLYDIKAMATLTTTSTTPASWAASSYRTSLTDAPVDPATVTTLTTLKNWNTSALIGSWYAQTPFTTSSMEFRTTATSSSANAPFTTVYVISKRYSINSTTGVGTYDTEWEYRGVTAAAVPVDEGGVRYFRYAFTPPTQSAQGAGANLLAIANNDSVRAIGVDAAGNALMTQAMRVGTTTVTPYTISSLGTYYADGAWANQSTAASGLSTSGHVSFAGTASSGTTNINVASSASIAAAGTIRVWFQVATQPGAPTPQALTCASSNNAVATVGPATLATFNGSSSSYFCEVTGVAAGTTSISISYFNDATGIFAATGSATAPVSTTLLSTLTVGTATLQSLANASGTATVTNAAGPPATSTTTISSTAGAQTFIVQPTWAGGNTQATAPMAYVCRSSDPTKVTVTCATTALNTGNGHLTVTITPVAPGTASITVSGRALGVGSGNAPVSNTALAVTVAAPAISGSIVTQAVSERIGNGGVWLTLLSGVTPAAGGVATNTYTCATSGANAARATATVVTIGGFPYCQVTGDALAAAAATPVTVDITATGGGAGFVPNTITTSITVNRRDGDAIAGTVTHDGIFPRSMTNGNAPYSFNMAGITSTAPAGISWSCTSSNAALLTATVSGSTCTLTPNGAAVAGGTAVNVVLTATGVNNNSGLTLNAITTTITNAVTRVP